MRAAPPPSKARPGLWAKLALSALGAMALLALGAWAAYPSGPPAGPRRAWDQGFLWGVAIAGSQNDGPPPLSDWGASEAAARLPEAPDRSPNFRRHEDGDLDRAASLGLNAFRFSLEWARLEPQEGQHDAAEVAYLHRLLAKLKARGMKPMAVLHHFATPQWAARPDASGRPGWASSKMPAAFARHAGWVAQEFGQEIDHYLTINEPSSMILGGYLGGKTPPFAVNPDWAWQATRGMLQGHAQAYAAIHAADPQAWVGLPDYNSALGAGPFEFDFHPGRWLAAWMPPDEGGHLPMDFAALHHYGFNRAPEAYPIRPDRWETHPEHLLSTLRAYHARFGLPLVVAECGFATWDGERPDGWSKEAHLLANLAALKAAKDEGLPVQGFFYWTLTDSYEWGSYSPRFGLWRVPLREGQQERSPTPCVAVYREAIRAGGPTEALWAQHPPPPSYQGAFGPPR